MDPGLVREVHSVSRLSHGPSVSLGLRWSGKRDRNRVEDSVRPWFTEVVEETRETRVLTGLFPTLTVSNRGEREGLEDLRLSESVTVLPRDDRVDGLGRERFGKTGVSPEEYDIPQTISTVTFSTHTPKSPEEDGGPDSGTSEPPPYPSSVTPRTCHCGGLLRGGVVQDIVGGDPSLTRYPSSEDVGRRDRNWHPPQVMGSFGRSGVDGTGEVERRR